MSWIKDQVERRNRPQSPEADSGPATSLEKRVGDKWRELVEGLERDADEFRRLNGGAEFDQPSPAECQVSNPQSKVRVLLRADLSLHGIHYDYQPEDDKTAVPEGGVISLRPGRDDVELYSADQRLSLEQARRLILEPLLFPPQPESLPETGT